MINQYLENLDGSKIKKAVVFSTSWLSKHSVDLIKKGLSKKGIKVEDLTDDIIRPGLIILKKKKATKAAQPETKEPVTPAPNKNE